jgi:hypothetical protein
MKRLSYLLAFSLLASFALAQPVPGLKKLGVSDIKATPAVAANVKEKGLTNSLERVTQSLDSQLINAIQQTRKFEVIARSDLAAILKEADFAGGKFQVSGVDNLLVVTLDDFQDYKETRNFAAMGKTVTARVIRLGAVGKIYDSVSGKLIESTNFEVLQREQQDVSGSSQKNGDLTDQYLRGVSEEMAAKIALRVSDVIFPVRVISRIDNQVTINRGENTNVAVGQIWNVFAQGKDLVDPDTGVILGKEEMLVGRVKINQVNPKTSIADIVEDKGIDRLAILRLPSK